MSEHDQTSGEAREFASVLLDIKGAHEDATEKMAALAAAVHETGLKGSLALKIELKPYTKDDGSIVVTTCVVTAAMPKPKAKTTLLFTSPDGAVTRDDPTQQVLPLAVGGARSDLPMRGEQ